MLQQLRTGDPAALAASYDRARATGILLLVLFTIVAVGPLLIFGRQATEGLTFYQLFWQDVPIVPLLALTMLLRPPAADEDHPWRTRAGLVLALSVSVILLAGWAGHHLIFQGHELSRDERMAVFDQEIFSQGKMFWPIPPDWRPLADALNRRFILTVPGDQFWVSGYLPVHSAFRALLGLVLNPAWASPILGATAAVSLWFIARRLWPHSKETAGVALLLLVTSSQFLITAMTPFSMTMHLALNLVWLALFLRDRWITHVLAVIVGFLATGIHQPLFHPLFAVPFLLLLLKERRWRVFGFYVAAYALIALFWMAWPLWISSYATAGAAAPMSCAVQTCASGASFVDRIVAAFGGWNWKQHIAFTGANVLRFMIWQHPLLVPLALFGVASCWKSGRIVLALAVSFLLPILVAAVILPWQGYGWGYRYVHPVMGNAILLACFGFERLRRGGLSIRRPLLITSAAAVALLVVHGWMASWLATPFVQTRQELEAIPADVVIVDSSSVPLAEDMVYNRFDLSNRPVLLLAHLIEPRDLERICARSTVAFYEAPRLHRISVLFYWKDPTEPTPHTVALKRVVKASGCRIVAVGGPSGN